VTTATRLRVVSSVDTRRHVSEHAQRAHVDVDRVADVLRVAAGEGEADGDACRGERAPDQRVAGGEPVLAQREPAEAVSKLKGGNSNWRGPLWFPTTFLLIESLRKIGTAFGEGYTLRLPASGDQPIGFRDVARDIARRMIQIFLRDAEGRRPVFGEVRKMQEDAHWRDHLLFYEYFHGDSGAGLGASHQTGWTALVANLIDEWR